MIVRDFGIIMAIIALVAAVAIGISSKKMTGEDDSWLEEVAEGYIEDKTGLDIDFTPESDEDEKE